MSDYTPSTDEVRDRFSLVVTSGLYEPSALRRAVKYSKQFDRWLAAVRADAWNEGAAHTLRREGHEVVDSAAVLMQNPHLDKGDDDR